MKKLLNTMRSFLSFVNSAARSAYGASSLIYSLFGPYGLRGCRILPRNMDLFYTGVPQFSLLAFLRQCFRVS